MKIDVSKKELESIVEAKEILKAISGGGDSDKHFNRIVKIIDKMLEKNKLKK
ncbi:MAG: hypothetical protein MUC49_02190 [Raineya sp.]|jgi:hypothetical protein|nr:hypothetical protein [Raineya sp.]